LRERLKFWVCLVAGATTVAAAPDSTWKRTDHPTGFTIEHPPRWTVETTGSGRILAQSAPAFVLVEPLTAIPASQRADTVLRRWIDSKQLETLPRPVRSARITTSTMAGPADALAHFVGIAADGVTPMRGQVLLACRGGVGTLYLAASLGSEFRQRLPELVGILRSLRFRTPAATNPQPAALRFQLFTEPREQAYSVELPVGWRVDLGVYREGGTPPRTEASAVAPNGAATVFLGERRGGPFVTPNPTLTQLGFREGATYDPSGIHPMVILRYLPGSQFARYWLNNRLPGAQPISEKSRPDLAERLSSIRYRYGNAVQARIDAGELTFEYRGQQGVVLAATEVYPVPGTGGYQWTVAFHAGYFAQSGQPSVQAAAALAHGIGTTQINLQWLRTERHFAQIDHNRAMETMRYTNQLFRQTVAERMASNERNWRAQGDLLAGTFRVLDPSTNEYTTVQAGSNFYYRVNGTNGVLGSNQELPAVDLTRMLRLDWDTPRPNP
jgi:hypothetical protein